MSEIPPPPSVPSVAALLLRTARRLSAHARGFLLLVGISGTLHAVLDALRAAAVAAFRARLFVGGADADVGQAAAHLLLDFRLPVLIAPFLGAPTLARALSLRFMLLLGPVALAHVAGFLLLSFATGLGVTILLARGGAPVKADVPEAMSERLAALFVPGLRLCGLFFLRSFLWLPLGALLLGKILFAQYGDLLVTTEMAGGVAFLFLAPRFALSPVLLVSGMPARESLRSSEERLKPVNWSVGVALAAAFAAAALFAVLSGFLIESFLPFSSLPAVVARAFADQTAFALAVAVLVQLGREILAVPAPVELSHALSPIPVAAPAGALKRNEEAPLSLSEPIRQPPRSLETPVA